MRWKDKRDVYIISNIYNGLTIQYTKKGIIKSKPETEFCYNLSTRGVDGLDQTLSYYILLKEERVNGGERFFLLSIGLSIATSTKS